VVLDFDTPAGKAVWVRPGGMGCRSRATESGHLQTPPPAGSLASYGKSGSPLVPRALWRAGLWDQRDQMSLCSPSSPWLSVA
jgi:hypothetical protein